MDQRKSGFMNESVHLIGMSGSLRKDSFNTRSLFAAQELLPGNVTMANANSISHSIYILKYETCFKT
jgi:hypothetical protein